MTEINGRIFEMVKLYLERLGTWEQTNAQWELTGMKKVKRFLGLRNHSCPACKDKIVYYTILCHARNDNGQAVGKARDLLFYTKEFPVPGNLPGNLYPLDKLQFGICQNEHRISRILVDKGLDRGGIFYFTHKFDGDKIIRL